MDAYSTDIHTLCHAVYTEKSTEPWVSEWLLLIDEIHDHILEKKELSEILCNLNDVQSEVLDHLDILAASVISEGITVWHIAAYIATILVIARQYRYSENFFEVSVGNFLKSHSISIWVRDHGGLRNLPKTFTKKSSKKEDTSLHPTVSFATTLGIIACGIGFTLLLAKVLSA